MNACSSVKCLQYMQDGKSSAKENCITFPSWQYEQILLVYVLCFPISKYKYCHRGFHIKEETGTVISLQH